MREQDQPRRSEPAEFDAGALLQTLARVTATVLGVVLIIAGAVYVFSLADSLLGVLDNPQGVADALDKLESAIGKGTLEVEHELVTIRGSRVLAIGVLGGVVIALVWLLIGVIRVGAEVVSITTSDKKAIRRVLRAALGKNPASGDK